MTKILTGGVGKAEVADTIKRTRDRRHRDRRLAATWTPR